MSDILRQGAFILRCMVSIPEVAPHVRLAHFNLFPVAAPETPDPTPAEQRMAARLAQFLETGRGYYMLQSTKVRAATSQYRF